MIHTLTLNPAIDRILYLDKFERNITNRIQEVRDTLGGKGTHVSVNLKLLGQDNTAFGICHGSVGTRVMDMLREAGIQVEFDHYEGDDRQTRTNYLLVEKSTDCTIIAESGVRLSQEELDSLIARMERVIRPGDYLLFSGDASNSPDPSIYNRIMHAFRDKDLRFFLDTSGKSLKECIQEGPYMIKPNLDELSTLTGSQVPEEDASIIEAINSLSCYQVPIIAVSLGDDGSIVRTPEGFYRVHPPRVDVCNTIGCGDCYLAGFVYGLSKGFPMEETLRIATAVSAATAESQLSVGYDPARANALRSQVTIEKLPQV